MGAPVHMVARDVLSDDRQELRRLNAELREKIHELERANADLEQFVWAASHDLKEPLRIIASYTQLLVKHQPRPDAETLEFSAHIVSGVERMRALIDAVLDYSLVTHQPLESGRTADAGASAAEAMQTLRAAIEEAKAQVEIAPLPDARIDPAALTQVFQNLLGNALKYRNEGRPLLIRVSAETRNGEVRFAVQDNGLGIKSEHYNRIFELFRRLHGEEIPGLGIGLALCKRIIERHGGRIWLDSQFGSGATFYFTLRAAGKAFRAAAGKRMR